MSELLSLPYSPWSERARWALEHHAIEYETTQYVPIFGVPALRLRLRKPLGRVSVPVYFDGDLTLTDSYDIARHADEVGHGAPLFPQGAEAVIAGWNERAERIMSAGRAATAIRVNRDPQAQKEALRGIVPDALRGPLRSVASFGAKYLVNKYYDGPLPGENQLRDDARNALVPLAEALEGRQFILDEFSYADIVMAVSLQFVKPVADRYIKLGPATRLCWTDFELAEEFPRLIEWRDRLYTEYRESSSARSTR